MRRKLWAIRTLDEVVYDLQNWGNGSGEEVFDYLTQSGLTTEQARLFLDLLQTVQTPSAGK